VVEQLVLGALEVITAEEMAGLDIHHHSLMLDLIHHHIMDIYFLLVELVHNMEVRHMDLMEEHSAIMGMVVKEEQMEMELEAAQA
jgi:hypothetical protein